MTLLRGFPPQIRMGSKYISEKVMSRVPEDFVQQGDKVISAFSFDSAMGFRDTSLLTLAGEKDADFLICLIGGSTTNELEKFLLASIAEKGVQEKVSVLNAGMPGYMVFNQHLYLTNWVMGKFKYKCSAVISVDGVNDIQFRIGAYTESLKDKTEWIPAYNGFQQKMDHDVREFMTPRGALAQLISNIAAGAGIREKVFYLMPYSSRLLFPVYAKIMLRKAYSDIGSEEFKLPAEVEDEIIFAYRNSLLDLAGSCRIRNIPFVAYLQPVHLKKYYDNPNPVINAANYIPRQMPLKKIGVGYIMDLQPLYSKTEGLYADLEGAFPENFGSIIDIFKNSESTDYYTDNCHYKQVGKELIARTIIDDLVDRNILHKQ